MISTTQVKDSFPFPPPLSPATFQEAQELAPGCNFDILKWKSLLTLSIQKLF